MLITAKSLKSATIRAIDGPLGRLADLFFDDQSWTTRYLVVQTGGWLVRKKVLVGPQAVRNVVRGNIHVALSKKQISDSPDIDSDEPISRQQEIDFYNYYRWPYYWSGSGSWAPGPYADRPSFRPPAERGMQPPSGDLPQFEGITLNPAPKSNETVETEIQPTHLQSMSSVIDLRLAFDDELFAHVVDFVMDTATWTIPFLVVDTRSWWPSPQILLPVAMVREIDISMQRVVVTAPSDVILEAPPFHDSGTIPTRVLRETAEYYSMNKEPEEKKAA